MVVDLSKKTVEFSLPMLWAIPLGAALPHLSISAGLGADVLAPVKALEAPEGGVHAAALARQRVYKAAVVVQRVLLRPA